MPEKKIIKIDTRKKNSFKLAEHNYKKRVLRVDKTKEFSDPIVDLTLEQSKKVDEFIKYCRMINKCVNCNTYIQLQNFSANEQNEIVMSCGDCAASLVDSTKTGIDYVIWFNTTILKQYLMSFQDNGFPSLMRYKFMGRCTQCEVSHDKEMIGWFDFRK